MLSIQEMRVDVGGVPDVENLTLTSHARRIAILGGGRGLFDAIAGVVAPLRGSITIDEKDPRALVKDGVLASCAIDLALPPKWTAIEYATWSARLAGASDADAKKSAREVLAELGVPPTIALGKASLEAQRAAMLAGTLATGARILVFQDPTQAMRPESARTFARALAKLIGDRAFILFASILPLASPLSVQAEDALVIRGSSVVAQGVPAEIAALERSFTVRATGDVSAFSKLVEQSGGRVTSNGTMGEMAVDLGAELKVRDLFALAADAQAIVVEVLPLGRAFT